MLDPKFIGQKWKPNPLAEITAFVVIFQPAANSSKNATDNVELVKFVILACLAYSVFVFIFIYLLLYYYALSK